MRPLLLIALLFAFLPPAQADSLYRCIARDGVVSYQSQACAAQQRLDRVVEYRPDPVMARVAPASAISRRQPRRYARSAGTRSVRAVSTPTATQRCRTGKARREVALQRLGLKRTYAQLSALDAEVRAACAGY